MNPNFYNNNKNQIKPADFPPGQRPTTNQFTPASAVPYGHQQFHGPPPNFTHPPFISPHFIPFQQFSPYQQQNLINTPVLPVNFQNITSYPQQIDTHYNGNQIQNIYEPGKKQFPHSYSYPSFQTTQISDTKPYSDRSKESRYRERNKNQSRSNENYSRTANNFERSSRSDRNSDRSVRRSRSRSRSHSRRRRSHRSRSRSSRRRVSPRRYENNKPKPAQRATNYTRQKKDLPNKSPNENKENNSESTVASPKEDVIKYVQTTLIPVFYSKDEKNSKIVKATSKLTHLCSKFEQTLLMRSSEARKKANLPEEATKVPNYRQLLLTKKFNKFARCTCDHGDSNKQHSTLAEKKCRKHANKNKISRSSGSSSDSSSSFMSSSSDSDSLDTTSSVKLNSSSSFDAKNSSSSSSSGSSGSSGSSSDESSSDSGKISKGKDIKKDKKEKKEKIFDLKSMEMKRKYNHPEHLHKDLCFNEPDQTNEGPLCKCKLKNTTFGTRHQIFYGEKRIEKCNSETNNSDRLFHYRMTIKPSANFTARDSTKIIYDNNQYTFEGFSLFSHEPIIEHLPDCVVVIYNQEYKLNIVKEDFIENFTVREIELLKKFIFEELLEMYDLKWKGYNVGNDGCNRFHVMPRFCRTLPYNGKEILSPCEILKYLIDNEDLIVDDQLLSKCHTMSSNAWLDYVESFQGSIVTCPGKRPASLRLDQLDRDHIKTKRDETNTIYPLIIHFSSLKANYAAPQMRSNSKYKHLYRKYFKLRHLLNNKTKPSSEDKAKLRSLADQMEAQIKKSTDLKETMLEISSQNFHKTGLRADIVQHAVLVPTFIEHLRFHFSLKFLEAKIGYQFKNRLLLQHALTHPSGAFLLHQNLGANPDHVKNVLFNCKIRNPHYGKLTAQKRKSILRKKGIHMLFSIMSQRAQDTEEVSNVTNYERLEFMGDKILELLVSKHLFCLFPMYDEGQLSEYRNAIVQNQYLAVLARKLEMHSFIIFYHGVDLCSNSALNHALANSFEALLAAIYFDSSLEICSDVLAKTLWNDEETMDLYNTWIHLPLHPIQAQLPDGDRHLIAKTEILQHVQIFEEMIGIEFKHIRLLAQAFCTRSASFNLITLGDNQRLEFLGDTVLNYVVSDYLYRFFPNHHEGHLSLLRSSLVCNSTQALLYDELGMGEFVLTSYTNNRQEPQGNLKRKADVFEAFVGALYLDQGIEAVKVFCNVTMFNKLKDIIMYQFWNDPKSRLQQCCLSLRDLDDLKPSLPTYKCIEEKGPPNNKIYRVAVYFNRKRIGEGTGKSIHDAEVEAAKKALNTKSKMFPILSKYVPNESSFTNFSEEKFKENAPSYQKDSKNQQSIINTKRNKNKNQNQ